MKYERKITFLQIVHTLVLISAFSFSTHLRAGLHQDMVSFEQRYIPTLLLTAESDAAAVTTAETLISEWNVFKQRHAYGYTDDNSWGFDLVNIERGLLDAQRMIQAGRYSQAHVLLSKVRRYFIAIRERHHIKFYIDELTRFEPHMHALLNKIRRQQADDIYLEISRAKIAWQSIAQREMNFHEYGLSLQQLEFLQQCLRKGEQILISVEEHYLAAEYEQLPALATQVKDVYANTYAIFAAH